MAVTITDPLALQIGLQICEERDDGLVTLADNGPDVCNRYGIAHGGFLHTLAHLSALLSASHCLGGSWELGDASCQFLRALRAFPAKTVTCLVGTDPQSPVFRAEVYDAAGSLCFTQLSTLRPAAPAGAPVTHTPKISAANPMPKDLDVEPPFPCLSTSFSRRLNCYSIRRQGTGLVYALDLNDSNCDSSGRVHRAAMFTLADAAAGGSLVRIEKKSPITVSGSMRYVAHGSVGLVEAIPRLTRAGRILYFYDVDIVDGTGKLLAVGQFVIQNLEHK